MDTLAFQTAHSRQPGINKNAFDVSPSSVPALTEGCHTRHSCITSEHAVTAKLAHSSQPSPTSVVATNNTPPSLKLLLSRRQRHKGGCACQVAHSHQLKHQGPGVCGIQDETSGIHTAGAHQAGQGIGDAYTAAAPGTAAVRAPATAELTLHQGNKSFVKLGAVGGGAQVQCCNLAAGAVTVRQAAACSIQSAELCTLQTKRWQQP